MCLDLPKRDNWYPYRDKISLLSKYLSFGFNKGNCYYGDIKYETVGKLYREVTRRNLGDFLGKDILKAPRDIIYMNKFVTRVLEAEENYYITKSTELDFLVDYSVALEKLKLFGKLKSTDIAFAFNVDGMLDNRKAILVTYRSNSLGTNASVTDYEDTLYVFVRLVNYHR